MHVVRLAREDDFDGWRAAARNLAAVRHPAEDIVWQVGDQATDLFADDSFVAGTTSPLSVPKDFLIMASRVSLHRHPERFSLLYALLLRVIEQPQIMKDHADRLLRRVTQLSDMIRRDMHKMRAFVRFREVVNDDLARFVAWFEPEHHIMRANAAFFVGRFTNMHWSILTPVGSIHWDTNILTEGPPSKRSDASISDPVESVWKAYYSAIFNPARLMPSAMLKEMPKKYWKNMPETELVSALIAGARKRELGMIAHARTDPVRTGGPAALPLLRYEAESCRRCPLWSPATKIVFGEGPPDAEIMIVGEQPGDQEDLAGKPFIGPAGDVFDRALLAAGITRSRVYVTNAVKHFKFEQNGKRRIHAKPSASEIDACQWWLEQERAIVRPKLVIAMGATAARAVYGKAIDIGHARGKPITLDDGTLAYITVHPSYLLRLPSGADREAAFNQYVSGLRLASASLQKW
jgi:DNA polymerase